MTRRAAAAAVALTLAAVGGITGCSSPQGESPSPTTMTRTRTVVSTLAAPTPTVTFTPAPARSVTPLPPGATPAAGEVEKRCPYIASTPEQDRRTNVADIDGSHVYRTTVLTGSTPVGCRFYFYAPPYEAIVDIRPTRFASATEAYNAMVRTGRAGREVEGRKDIIAGVDGVLYRTTFFGEDGTRDWACVFAAGRTMVVVHTQRTDTSLNALLVARAIAGKF